MNHRRRILVSSILVMTGGMFCTTAVTLTVLFMTTREGEYHELRELAETQQHLIEAIVRHDRQHHPSTHPNGSAAMDSLAQIVDAHAHDPGFGETGEILFARRQGDRIVFLVPFRHGDGGMPDPIPWQSALAEPMRRALSGQHGTMTGVDYRGKRVLAAYAPIAAVNWGVVAKSDVAEALAPFVTAAIVSGGVTVLLVFVGVGLALRFTAPLVHQLEERDVWVRAIVDASTEAMVAISDDGRVTLFNHAAERTFGRTAGEMLGRPPDCLMPEEYREQHGRSVLGYFADGEPDAAVGRTVRLVGMRSDGSRFPIEFALSVTVCGGKRFALAVIRDLSERLQTENELRQLSAAVEQSPATVVITDTEGTIQYVNPRFTETTGYTAAEAVGQNPRFLKSGEMAPDAYREMWETIRAGDVWRGEFHNKKKNGELYWEAAAISPIRNAQGVITHFLAVKEEISAQKKAEAELRQAKAVLKASASKFRTLFESSSDAVMLLDEEGFFDCNAATLKIFGCASREAFCGKHPSELSPPTQPCGTDSMTLANQRIATALKEGANRFEWIHQRVDGTAFPTEVLLNAMTLDDRPVLQAVVRDITERRQAEEALGRARDAADAANQAKSEFLANMSHEIRTPMTAILGFAENLLDPEQSESERLNAVHTIRRNGEYLLGIINDILDLSKIEAGKMTMERVRCAPCRIVAEVASLTRVRSHAKGLATKIEYVGPIPETIECDPTRLRQILINLIGNAVKFTEAGSISLITGLTDDPADPHLQFDVVDTGLGMSEAQVAGLFRPFMQADASTTRRFGGTGLGLTISKRLAQMLGGDVTVVESREGVGTRFRVTVATGPLDGVKMLDDPLSATSVVDTAPGAAAKTDAAALPGCRILLAEDGPDNQRLIAYILKKAGAEVTVKVNGRLAADAAMAACDEGHPFDVILMDMQMPVMDGYEATGWLRRKGYAGPIIALTAHAMAGEREKCIKAGCDDYATKPIDRARLFDIIRKYYPLESTAAGTAATQEGGTSGAAEAAEATETRAEAPPSAAMLVSRHADDPDLAELVEQFVEQLPDRVAALQAALAEHDFETLGGLVHQLSGAAGSYGFPPITAAAKRLQEIARTQRDLGQLREALQALADLCDRARASACRE